MGKSTPHSLLSSPRRRGPIFQRPQC